MSRRQALWAAIVIGVFASPASATEHEAGSEAGASGVPASAVLAAASRLDPVEVIGQTVEETSTSGALGLRKPLETPFSISGVARELLDNRMAANIADVSRNDPSVSIESVPGSYAYSSVAIRGFSLGNLSNYRQDGLLTVNLTDTPLENKARVEFLKGMSGFLFGFGSPGGIVNYVTKRPTDDRLIDLRLGLTADSLFKQHVDLGGRFGGDAFGYRINLVNESGSTYIDDAEIDRTLIAGAFDWRISDALSLDLDFERQRKDPHGQNPYFYLDTGVALPDPIDPRRMIGQPWVSYETETDVLGGRLGWTFADGWRLTAVARRSDVERDAQFVDGLIVNDAGDYTGTYWRDALQRYVADSADAYVEGRFTTGAVDHQLTAGIGWLSTHFYRGDYQTIEFDSNIHAPTIIARPDLFAVRGQYRSLHSIQRSLYVSDTMSFDDRWSLVLGARRAEIEQRNFNFRGETTRTYQGDTITPTVAVMFKPNPRLMTYLSYVEGVEPGGIAPPQAANAGEMLPPLESRQVELGLKMELQHGMVLNAALFEMDRTSQFRDPVSNIFGQDGLQRHRGVEASVSGQLTPRLSMVAGVLAVDAEIVTAASAVRSGKDPVGVPRLTTTVWGEYQLTEQPSWFVSAGVRQFGSVHIDALNTQQADGYAMLDLGARFETYFGDRRATFRVGVDNVLDERYWLTDTWETLYAGEPRVWKLSAQIEF